MASKPPERGAAAVLALLVLPLMLLSLAPSPLRAQADAADDQRARAIFESGRTAFTEHRYLEAIESFERVFAMTGHPVMLLNIGNAWAKLDEAARAIAAYRQYLALSPDDPDRGTLEARIQALSALPPSPSAAAEGDGGEAASEPPGWLLGRRWTWVAAGASVVAAGSAVLLWTAADSRHAALRGSCADQGCSERQIDAVQARVTGTNVALALSLLGAAAAAGLWFYEDPERAGSGGPSLQVEVTAAGAQLRGRF